MGLDMAKNVFPVHGVDAHGKGVLRKTLKRDKVTEFFANLPPCLMGIEAFGSAHHWARTLAKWGHTVRLMAGQFVAPYRKSGKNDGHDAEAICEAVGRPNRRFVSVKSEEQQAVLIVHRARSLRVENRTAPVNQMRGLLAEFGRVIPQGIEKLRCQLPDIWGDAENGLPALARETLADLREQLRHFDERVTPYDRQIEQMAAKSEPAQRWMKVEGIGPSPRLRGWRAWAMPRSSTMVGRWRPGSVWCQGNIPAAASSAWDPSPNGAMRTCGAC